MKNLFNNISFDEKKRILEQHRGGVSLEIKNFQKLLKNKLGNVQPLMEGAKLSQNEGAKLSQINPGEVKEQGDQATPEQNRYVAAGYKEVADIDLPNGNYIGNPDGYEQAAQAEKLFNVSDLHIYDKSNKKTGYVINLEVASRSGVQNANVIITNKKANYDGIYYFKDVGYKPTEQPQNQKLINKVATEGLKNITPQMISSPPFDGYYSGYVISGTFGGVDYSWDFNGVEGMSGVRGSVDGQIETESNDYLMRNSRVTDADPNGTWVGFGGGGTHFGCYKTTGGNIKCAKI